MPVTLLVAADYPESSPVIFGDGGGDQPRTNFSCISGAVDAAFRRALRELPEPRSIKETARVWATCVRRAVTEFAQLRGGGTMCSSLNRWESCVGA
uniref:ARC105/Med15 mediator subunit C-terminal domain-containing protein n=1 Tax=Arundo donax TaxID=35708 RepID=A0A0A8YZN4_ARUDO